MLASLWRKSPGVGECSTGISADFPNFSHLPSLPEIDPTSRVSTQLAGNDHERLADSGSKTTVALHGQQNTALANELDGHGTGIKTKGSTKPEIIQHALHPLNGGHILLGDLCDLADSGKGAGALENFLAIHLAVHAENRAQLELPDGIRITV